MKYYLDFLSELNKGHFHAIYLFYGPEVYLKDQAVKRMKESLLPAGGEELNYEVMDGSVATGKDIAAAARQTSFMPGRRLVIVRDPACFQASSGRKEQDEKAVLEYLTSPNATCSLVFVATENVDRRRKLYKEMARSGKVIEFARLKPADLVKWLAKLAGEEGCTLDREAAGELLARCGKDMSTLYNEIKKIAAFTGGGQPINLNAVRELVAVKLEDSIFDVVDAIGAKDCNRALSGIRDLLLLKHQPQQITGMVARQFRLIYQVRGLIEAGRSREEIISYLKLHPFVYKKISDQVRNFSIVEIVNILNELAEMDYRIKTGRGAFFSSIQTIIIKICALK